MPKHLRECQLLKVVDAALQEATVPIQSLSGETSSQQLFLDPFHDISVLIFGDSRHDLRTGYDWYDGMTFKSDQITPMVLARLTVPEANHWGCVVYEPRSAKLQTRAFEQKTRCS